jgi:RNA polymerase sigma factor (sigma-70 family)
VKALGDLLAEDVDAAFPRLVEAVQARVYSLSLALTGNADDAQDVAQDAFVRAYRALKRYPAARLRALRPRPWLAKIALNVWRNRVRTRRSTSTLETDLPADERDNPDIRTARSRDAAELRAMLGELPRRYRLAVVLRHAYDVPYAEAAAVLGIPVGTLKANVHRGTRMLRAQFERRQKAEK